MMIPIAVALVGKEYPKMRTMLILGTAYAANIGRMGPVVEELAGDYEGKVNFVKVNVDQAGELASKYNVFSIPTLILLNRGEIIAQQVGAGSKETYENMIDRALEKI